MRAAHEQPHFPIHQNFALPNDGIGTPDGGCFDEVFFFSKISPHGFRGSRGFLETVQFIRDKFLHRGICTS